MREATDGAGMRRPKVVSRGEAGEEIEGQLAPSRLGPLTREETTLNQDECWSGLRGTESGQARW